MKSLRHKTLATRFTETLSLYLLYSVQFLLFPPVPPPTVPPATAPAAAAHQVLLQVPSSSSPSVPGPVAGGGNLVKH